MPAVLDWSVHGLYDLEVPAATADKLLGITQNQLIFAGSKLL
jgi:hypothetical protein